MFNGTQAVDSFKGLILVAKIKSVHTLDDQTPPVVGTPCHRVGISQHRHVRLSFGEWASSVDISGKRPTSAIGQLKNKFFLSSGNCEDHGITIEHLKLLQSEEDLRILPVFSVLHLIWELGALT